MSSLSCTITGSVNVIRLTDTIEEAEEKVEEAYNQRKEEASENQIQQQLENAIPPPLLVLSVTDIWITSCFSLTTSPLK